MLLIYVSLQSNCANVHRINFKCIYCAVNILPFSSLKKIFCSISKTTDREKNIINFYSIRTAFFLDMLILLFFLEPIFLGSVVT